MVYLVAPPNVDLLIPSIEISIGQEQAGTSILVREKIAVVSTPNECPRQRGGPPRVVIGKREIAAMRRAPKWPSTNQRRKDADWDR